MNEHINQHVFLASTTLYPSSLLTLCSLLLSSKSTLLCLSVKKNGGEEDNNNNNNGGNNHCNIIIRVVNIYPLSGYYFGSKQALSLRNETDFDRIQKFKSNYAANGMRTCVEAVMLIELLKHPHLLVLQVRNTFFKLPGGRLRPGESEIQGLKRKLSSKLSPSDEAVYDDWEVGECLGMWWRADFDTLLCPHLPLHAQRPKECTKLFLVKLSATRRFNVPKNLKLLAVPLSDLHENSKDAQVRRSLSELSGGD